MKAYYCIVTVMILVNFAILFEVSKAVELLQSIDASNGQMLLIEKK